MARLLYITASPRGERSYSVRVADAFVQAYRHAHPADVVDALDVFTADLPQFDGLAVRAKYALLHGQKPTEAELDVWKNVESLISQFKAADKYVLAVPMWNFGIPYRLKHYIDILVQPGYTFAFNPQEGYKGLVTGKPAFVAYSRGGEYAPDSAAEHYDLQKRYLELALGFIGVTDVRSVVVEPTLAGGPTVASSRLAEALAKAKDMARGF